MLKLKDPSSDNFDAHSNFAVTEGLLEATKYALESIDQFCNTYNINIQDCKVYNPEEGDISSSFNDDNESFTICKDQAFSVTFDCTSGLDNTCSCNNEGEDASGEDKERTDKLLSQNKTIEVTFNFKLNGDNSFYNSNIEIVKLVKCNSDEYVNALLPKKPIYYSYAMTEDGYGIAALPFSGGLIDIAIPSMDGSFDINQTNLEESGYHVVQDSNNPNIYRIYDSDDSYTSDNVIATFVEDGENSYVMDSLGNKYPPTTKKPETGNVILGVLKYATPNSEGALDCFCTTYLPDGSTRYDDCMGSGCDAIQDKECYCYDNDLKYCSKLEKLNCTYGKVYDNCFDEYKVEDGYYVYIKNDSLTIDETSINTTP